MPKNAYISGVKSSKVTIPDQIAKKYRIEDGDKVVFVEFGDYVLLMKKEEFENKLDPFISGRHNLERINKKDGKEIVLEAIRYLTRIGPESLWFNPVNIAQVIDNSSVPIFTQSDYETLEKYLNELADEGLIVKNISCPSTSPVYRAKL